MPDGLVFFDSFSNDIQKVATFQLHTLESLDFHPSGDIQTSEGEFSKR